MFSHHVPKPDFRKPDLLEQIAPYFQNPIYRIETLYSKRLLNNKLHARHEYSCVILGPDLPLTDSVEICKNFREGKDYTPIVMLSASNQSHHHIQALLAGADDSIPLMELDELFIRTHSLLRRQVWNTKRNHTSIFHFGDVRINFDTHEVSFGDKALQLTSLELKLLRYFVQNRNRVIERKELLAEVWKLHNYPNTRTVDNFVMRLRRLLEPRPNKPIYFLSVRGSGYKFHSEVKEVLIDSY